MKKILFTILLTIPFNGFAQYPFLEEKNGWKDLKLNSNIDEYDFVKKCTESAFSFEIDFKFETNYQGTQTHHGYKHAESGFSLAECQLWEVNSYEEKYRTFLTKNDINKVLISTFNNVIFKITVYVNNLKADLKVGRTLLDVYSYESYDLSLLSENMVNDMFNFSNKRNPRKNELVFIRHWYGNGINLDVSTIHNQHYSGAFADDKRRVGWKVEYYIPEMEDKVEELMDFQREKEKSDKLEKLKNKF